MRFVGRCYRAHDPKWSFAPLSGEGAARTGGRFNRKGEPTLYLSLDVMTSLGERDLPHRLAVYDPAGRLPRDQLSWPGRSA